MPPKDTAVKSVISSLNTGPVWGTPKTLPVGWGRKACLAELDAARRGAPSQFLYEVNYAETTNGCFTGTQWHNDEISVSCPG